MCLSEVLHTYVTYIDNLMHKEGVGRKEVKCKDCKYWDADDHECNIKTGWFACGADWYCADGERAVKS